MGGFVGEVEEILDGWCFVELERKLEYVTLFLVECWNLLHCTSENAPFQIKFITIATRTSQFYPFKSSLEIFLYYLTWSVARSGIHILDERR